MRINDDLSGDALRGFFEDKRGGVLNGEEALAAVAEIMPGQIKKSVRLDCENRARRFIYSICYFVLNLYSVIEWYLSPAANMHCGKTGRLGVSG